MLQSAIMGIVTLFRYLIGDREAVLAIAGTRHSLWVGFLFVLSAGLAREYDGEDLLHAPWYVLLPLAASLVASFLLFYLAYGVARLKEAAMPPFFTAYDRFLGLFWMTAPLAWPSARTCRVTRSVRPRRAPRCLGSGRSGDADVRRIWPSGISMTSTAWGVVRSEDGRGRVVWAELGAAADLP